MITPSPFPSGSSVCAYLRDSGGEEQDLSVAQQEQAVRAWCLERGLVLLSVYQDLAAPGSSTVGRAAFQEMIHWFRRPGCPAAGIVIWKYSRFSRSMDDSQFYRADLRRRGFILHSLNDSIPEGINGKFFEAAVDWMNERFLEDLSTDVKRGLMALVKNHRAIPGTPPRGFQREPFELGRRRDGSPHIVARWVPDPEWWDACRQAWRMRALNATYKQIHARTHLFTSLNSYKTFFTNPIYRGELHYSDLVVPDFFERLVDDETWSAVQKLAEHNAKRANLSANNPYHPRRPTSRFLLSGLVRCVKCGALLNGHPIKFRGDKTYDYYVCSNRKRKLSCDARQVPRQVLEQAVVESLSDFLEHPEVILEKQRQQAAFQAHEDELLAGERADIQRRLAAVRRKITNVLDTIEEKGKGASHLVDRLVNLEAQETQLLTDLATLGKSDLQESTKATPAQLASLADRIRDLYKKGDQEQLRLVLSGIVHKVVAERDGKLVRGLVSFYLPPDPGDPSPPDELPDPDADGESPSKKFMPSFSPTVGAPLYRHKYLLRFTVPLA